MSDYLRPIYLQSIWETLFMALITLVIGGICGLVMGILLYATRRGGLLANKVVHTILNVIVNIIRPRPFIIFMTAIAPLTLKVVGTTIGVRAATFPLCIAATFAISRIVEQNLVTVEPGVIEAARAMGAGPWRILFDVVAREALGPLIHLHPHRDRRHDGHRRCSGRWRPGPVRHHLRLSAVRLDGDGRCRRDDHHRRPAGPVPGQLVGATGTAPVINQSS